MGGVGWGDGEGRGSVGEIGGIRGVRRRAGAAPGNAAHAGYTTAAAHTHTHTCTQPTQAGHRTEPCTGRTHVRSARASTHQAHGRAHALPAHARPSSGTLSPVAHPPRTWPRRGRSRVHARRTATRVPLPHPQYPSHAHTNTDCLSYLSFSARPASPAPRQPEHAVGERWKSTRGVWWTTLGQTPWVNAA